MTLFLNSLELLLVTCPALLKNYGNTAQKQPGIQRMRKSCNSKQLLGRGRNERVGHRPSHTGTESLGDGDRDGEVAGRQILLFRGNGTFSWRLHARQHATVVPPQSDLSCAILPLQTFVRSPPRLSFPLRRVL